MNSPSQLKQKAQRKYKEFLQASIKETSFFPLKLPVGKISQDYMELGKELTQLIDNSKNKIGYGYSLELTPKNTRKYGWQSLPTQITIDSEADYLKLLHKKSEFSKFKADIRLIHSLVPQLKQWLFEYPQKVVEHAGKWEGLLKVCRYFLANPNPNLYIRELPIAVHTKFIEENTAIITSLLREILPHHAIHDVNGDQKNHIFERKFSLKYDEPLVRMRILDQQVREKNSFPVFDLLTPLSEFKQLNLQASNCFITENKMNFLTIPELQDSITIWGCGYSVRIMNSVNWLFDYNIFYWGDFDPDGFKILSLFRGYFPQTISIMMDQSTFKEFEEFTVNVEPSQPEILSNLTSKEYSLYAFLCRQGKRLEQERINQKFVVQYLGRFI